MHHHRTFLHSPPEGSLETVPCREPFHLVAPDVVGLRRIMVNVYFVGVPDQPGWVLIDAGLPGSAGPIRAAAEARFGPGAKPAAIILTHGHFDHVGGLASLLREWDVPVYAHRLEMPYLDGRSSYPPPDPTVGGGAMASLAALYPKRPIALGRRLRALPADGTVPELPGWAWLHTPGHTAGHVSLFRERDRVLLAGDAFVTTRQESALAVLQQRVELNGPPAYFTTDWQAAAESVELLDSLNPEVAATGHGVPLRGESMRRALHELAAHFVSIAVPHHGRYVDTPAIANAAGVISVPPRQFSKRALAFGVATGAVLMVGMVAQRMSSNGRGAVRRRGRKRW